MPDTLSQAFPDWQNFYLLVGGASATLVGLMFVAMSLRAGQTTAQAGVQIFASPSVVHFVYALATASVVLIPTMTRVLLGTLLLLVGLGSQAFVIRSFSYMYGRHRRAGVDAADWLWYFLMPSAGYLLYIATGIGLLKGISQAFNGLATVTVLLLLVGIHNAWDLIVGWVTRKGESSSEVRSTQPLGRQDSDATLEHQVDTVPQSRKRPAEKPTSLALSDSHQTEVARMIQEVGLNSRKFTWALQPNRHALIGPLISALVHTPTGCFFRFEYTEDVGGRRVSVYLPDKGAHEVTKAAGSWEDQLDHVREWLRHLADSRR